MSKEQYILIGRILRSISYAEDDSYYHNPILAMQQLLPHRAWDFAMLNWHDSDATQSYQWINKQRGQKFGYVHQYLRGWAYEGIPEKQRLEMYMMGVELWKVFREAGMKNG